MEEQSVPETLEIKTFENKRSLSLRDKKRSPLLMIIFAILLILSLGATGFLAYQNMQLQKQIVGMKVTNPTPVATADSTANWKAYNGAGFSFKYPGDYFQFEQPSANGIYLAPSAGQGGNGPKFLGATDVWLDAQVWPGTYSSVDDFFNVGQYVPNNQNTIQKVPFVIGGMNGFKTTYSYPAVAGNVTVYDVGAVVLKDGKVYSIDMSSWSSSNLTQQSAMFDQILSTFQFTTSVSQIDTSNWQTYTSVNQKISFQYPSDWLTIKPVQQSNDPNADLISLQSPDKEITVNWISSISGLGGACDANAPVGPPTSNDRPCPLFTLISKTPLSTTSRLYVVEGTITQDNVNFSPWIGIQDNSNTEGELTLTTRTMGYDEFSVDNGKTDAVFSTGMIYASGPSLSQADANAWFNKPSVQTAKQILSSLQLTQ